MTPEVAEVRGDMGEATTKKAGGIMRLLRLQKKKYFKAGGSKEEFLKLRHLSSQCNAFSETIGDLVSSLL